MKDVRKASITARLAGDIPCPYSRQIRRMAWIVAIGLVAWSAGSKLVQLILEHQHAAATAHAGD